MKTLFVLHDSFGGPLQDWIPWLRMTFEQAGHKVVVPNFPTPVGQSKESWHVVVEAHKEFLTNETIVIGFGTGGTCWLKELESSHHDTMASILVAAPVTPSPHIGYSKANESFIREGFKWDEIKAHGGAKALFYGSDDQLIAKGDEDLIGEQLGLDPFIIENAGHFTIGSGYAQFIQLADLIQELISPKPSIPLPPAKQNEEVSEEKPTTLSMSYYEDMARVMKTNAGNVMSGVLKTARSRKEEALATNPARPKNMMYALFAVVLVALSLGSLGYIALSLVKNSGPVLRGPGMLSSLVRKDAETFVDLTGIEHYEAEAPVLAEAIKTGPELTLSETIFTSNKVRLSFQSAYRIIHGEPVPGQTASFLNLPWMYGHWYKTETSQVPFIILSVKSYDGVFAGLRAWEPTLAQDVGIFFGLSEETRRNPTFRAWKDIMIQNRALRQLVDEQAVILEKEDGSIGERGSQKGAGPVLYTGFLSDTLLVITTDPDIFNELNRRIADEQFLH